MANKFHIIFKTHLDVGFTDFAAVVEERYLKVFVPGAIQLAEEMRLRNGNHRFVWTVGSWLIYKCLETYKGGALKNLEAAIARGDVAWHALPFTMHSELVTPSLYEFGLSISQELDQRFGRRTHSAKVTDVPGHTRGIVPLLADAGVDFLHIGSNPGSTPPNTPELFTWREPDSKKSLTVMYQKGGYGDIFTRDNLKTGLLVSFTEDNLGPPTPMNIDSVYKIVEKKFPNAKATASTFDAFAEELLAEKPKLPIIEQELGDTWIHGAGTAPVKVARFRELSRLRDQWLADGVPEKFKKKYISLSENLLLIGEHTWGLDVKSHLRDDENFSPAALRKARKKAAFKKMEKSWNEQAEYVNRAAQALKGTRYYKEISFIKQEMPVEAQPATCDPISTDSLTFNNEFFNVLFSKKDGSIIYLKDTRTGLKWAGAKNVLGSFKFETFGANEIGRFLKQYGYIKKGPADWFPKDFGKPGIETTLKKGVQWNYSVVKAFSGSRLDAPMLCFLLAPPEDIKGMFGAPEKVYLSWRFPTDQPVIELDICWCDKPASRIPEAIWTGFTPAGTDSSGWRMHKLGHWISPLDVIKNGNRKLHAVQTGVKYECAKKSLFIETIDAPLVAPGEPSLYNYNNRQPALKKGFHFNLFNNVWGTNFPQWTSEDAYSRFRLHFGDGKN